MKRIAHTLAEVLVALTIIGVIGAVVVPAIGKFKPDVNKIRFIKTYDAIVSVNNHLISDETIYSTINSNEVNLQHYPLLNTDTTNIDGNSYSGAGKYCKLLSLYLSGSSVKCSTDGTISKTLSTEPSFITQDGSALWVYTASSIDKGENSGSYKTQITIDVDGTSEGENCLSSSTTCSHPDRFQLNLYADGRLVAADPKTQYYLTSRANFRLNRDYNAPEVPEFKAEIADLDKPYQEDDETSAPVGGGNNPNGGGDDPNGGDDDPNGSGDDPENVLKSKYSICTQCGAKYIPSRTGVKTCQNCMNAILGTQAVEPAVKGTGILKE